MKTLVRITLATLLLAGVPAHAQDDAEASPPRYAVEILVFQHLDQSRSTAETPLPAKPLAAGAAPAGPELEFVLLSAVNGGPGFARLAENELSLGNAWQRLERLDAYRPLAYLSWSQLAHPQAAAQSLWLNQAGVTPPGLSGEVTLYKERFLHLALDLEWELPPDMAQRPELAVSQTARIEESRLLRGDVVQYFDNPQFGAITYVRELEVAEPADTAADPSS